MFEGIVISHPANNPCVAACILEPRFYHSIVGQVVIRWTIETHNAARINSKAHFVEICLGLEHLLSVPFHVILTLQPLHSWQLLDESATSCAAVESDKLGKHKERVCKHQGVCECKLFDMLCFDRIRHNIIQVQVQKPI